MPRKYNARPGMARRRGSQNRKNGIAAERAFIRDMKKAGRNPKRHSSNSHDFDVGGKRYEVKYATSVPRPAQARAKARAGVQVVRYGRYKGGKMIRITEKMGTKIRRAKARKAYAKRRKR